MHRVLYLVCGLFLVSVALGQTSVSPRILSSHRSETKRNAQLEKVLISVAGITEVDDKTTRYYYNYVDLNGDGVSEVLVYVFEGHFCGTGGCDAFLFRKVNGRYALLSHFEPVRNPIVVSNKRSHGWKDLIFFNSGGGINPGYYSKSKFNGKNYLENPTVEENAPPHKVRESGVAYLVGAGNGDSGLSFKFR